MQATASYNMGYRANGGEKSLKLLMIILSRHSRKLCYRNRHVFHTYDFYIL